MQHRILVLSVVIATILSKPSWAEECTASSHDEIIEVVLRHLEIKFRKEKPSVTLSLEKEPFSEVVPIRFCADDFAEHEDLLGCPSADLVRVLQASQDSNPETWKANDLKDLRSGATDEKVWLSPLLVVKSLPLRRFVLYLAVDKLGLVVVECLPSARIVLDLPLGGLNAH